MGLTLHWKFALTGKRDPAAVLESLRQAALDLPFAEVDDRVTSLEGRECVRSKKGSDERPGPTRRDFILITCAKHVENEAKSYESVPPTELHCFYVRPGERCESAVFFLARYPKTVTIDRVVRPVPRARTWTSSTYCKTQYASNHGVANFLRCHLGLIALCDRARELGMKVTVRDDGDFERTRDVPALLKSLDRWNELIAGFGAALEAAMPPGVVRVGGLTGRPDLEHLEARGLERFGELASFIRKLR